MTFTVDWFVNNISVWEEKVIPFIPPTGSILEIGSYEGKSTSWIADRLPQVTIRCVDTFEGGMEHQDVSGLFKRFKENTAKYGKRIKVNIGPSDREVRKFSRNSFDLVYVDASHQAIDVLTDAVQSWYCLKTGGLMVFDDYKWDVFTQPELNPRLAIDCFLTSFINHYELIHQDYQVIIKKI
jgi:predicted O-methyltransferase YrrM